MVLVIMPMIVGAIAAAIVATQSNSGSTQAALSDSANAQITSEYYPRDVQGAQYVTTYDNIPTPYTAQSPQLCSNPNTTLTGTTLVLGLYRPATSSNATSVSYWTGSTSTPLPSLELVRDYCTVGPSYTSTFSSEVVMSDDVSGGHRQHPAIPVRHGGAGRMDSHFSFHHSYESGGSSDRHHPERGVDRWVPRLFSQCGIEQRHDKSRESAPPSPTSPSAAAAGAPEQRAPGLRCFSPKVSPASTFRSPKWPAGIATASRRHPRCGGRPRCCRAHEAIGPAHARSGARHPARRPRTITRLWRHPDRAIDRRRHSWHRRGGLLGGVAAAIGSSGTHRSMTSLDAIVKSFVETAKYEIQQQPYGPAVPEVRRVPSVLAQLRPGQCPLPEQRSRRHCGYRLWFGLRPRRNRFGHFERTGKSNRPHERRGNGQRRFHRHLHGAGGGAARPADDHNHRRQPHFRYCGCGVQRDVIRPGGRRFSVGRVPDRHPRQRHSVLERHRIPADMSQRERPIPTSSSS